MDDEVARPGQKIEFTTKEDEFYVKFKGLSMSGHDLTPLSDEEIRSLEAGLEEEENTYCKDEVDENYLGEGRKGLYCARLGGIPLFSSGCRVDEKCTEGVLVFDEPADEDHVVIHGNEVLDVRCSRQIATLFYDSKLYYNVRVHDVVFHELNKPLPVESQPENFWGTEGQYSVRAEIDGTGPLSY